MEDRRRTAQQILKQSNKFYLLNKSQSPVPVWMSHLFVALDLSHPASAQSQFVRIVWPHKLILICSPMQKKYE
jgi:hypothetical protein